MIQPEQLGPFRIIRVIGRGGMGAVYEGAHVQTHESVAVKVLVAPVDDEEEDVELSLRFTLEIETLKKLRHPNIVQIYGYGEEDPFRYYVMELIHGQSLQQELRRNRVFTWQEVCRLAWEMSQALKHAHDRGIIHRDIKPANILLQNDGLVKLSDYGIAHIFGSSRFTHINSVVGTLEYMSPEQSQGGPITPKSDFFSLGAVLYTLLLGKPPYQAKTLPEIVKNHQTETPERILLNRPDVPEKFESIIYELLSIRPENRPVNAYILGRRLQVILKAFIGNPDLITIKPTAPLQVFAKESPVKPVLFPSEKVDSGQGHAEFASPKNENPLEPKKSRSAEIETDSTEKEIPHDLEFSLQEENNAPVNTSSDPDDPISIPGMDTFRLRENKLDSPPQSETSVPEQPENENKAPSKSGLGKKHPQFTMHDFTWTSISQSKAIAAFQPKLNTKLERLIQETLDQEDRDDESQTLAQASSDDDFYHDSLDYGGPKIGGCPVRSDFIRKPGNEKKIVVSQSETIEKLRLNPRQTPPEQEDSEKERKNRVQNFMGSDLRNVSEFSLKRELTRWSLKQQARITKSQQFKPENQAEVGKSAKCKEITAIEEAVSPKDVRESISQPWTRREGTSKFVVFQDDELGDYIAQEINHPGQLISAQTLLALFFLIVSGLFCWYMLQPVSADTLYKRIAREIGKTSESVTDENIMDLLRAEENINLFLSQYPNDPRHEELDRYVEELKLYKLQREFTSRITDVKNLQPIERACYEAIVISKSRPEEAILKFQAIIDLYGPANVPDSKRLLRPYEDQGEPESSNTPEVKLQSNRNGDKDEANTGGRPRSAARSDLCIELARRRLAAIKASLEPILVDQKELIRSRLEDAKELDKTAPDRARAIREAIIELYQDKNWAAPYIEETQKML